jgi:hypothetical protein
MMMMFHQPTTLFFLLLSFLATTIISAQSGDDYLDAAPATVYEDTVMSPQNM